MPTDPGRQALRLFIARFTLRWSPFDMRHPLVRLDMRSHVDHRRRPAPTRSGGSRHLGMGLEVWSKITCSKGPSCLFRLTQLHSVFPSRTARTV